MNLTFATGCSGIGAPEVAWGDRLGWTGLWCSEIDPFASAVLKEHWPHIPNVGDFMNICKMLDNDEIEAPDIFIAGTPCQAFSIAGLRKSLKDKRGGLTLEYCKIANSMDEQRRRHGKQETVFVWENVLGVFSTKDNAFGCLIAGLTGDDRPCPPPQTGWTHCGVAVGARRTLAWRVLDAQYFGVAQRRRRVFVIATARANFCAPAGLFEFNIMPRYSPPRRETQYASPKISRTGVEEADCDDIEYVDEIARTLEANYHKGPATDWKERTIVSVRRKEGVYSIGSGQIHEIQHASFELAHTLSRINGGQSIIFQELSDDFTFNETTITVKSNINHNEHKIRKTNLSFSITTDEASFLNATVRRLTTVECAKLQGFPEHHTEISYRGKPKEKCPPTNQYKAYGNAMCCNVIEWLGTVIEKEIQNPTNFAIEQIIEQQQEEQLAFDF